MSPQNADLIVGMAGGAFVGMALSDRPWWRQMLLILGVVFIASTR